ncbi:hypothetical protein [Streptomyces sp. NPDC059247]|uniref:hypothetical protein n=1 Tax=Streptomyces sp. NPDC059247 TaxID=3346790 RepID=UPI0036983A6C
MTRPVPGAQLATVLRDIRLHGRTSAADVLLVPPLIGEIVLGCLLPHRDEPTQSPS